MYRTTITVLVLGLALMGSCGTGKLFGNASSKGAQPLDSALVELEQAPVPAGIDPMVFEQLQAKLAAALKSRGLAKFTCAPPEDDRSQALLSFDQETAQLSWYCYCTGDYNQDGMVTVNDITPLGQNFNAAGPFDPASALSCVDGDKNGMINVSDITPIGQNFNCSVTGYNIYTSLSAGDYPGSNTAGNGGASLVAMLPYPSTAAAGQRKRCSQSLANPQPAAYVWVRPTDGGSEGTPSNMIQAARHGEYPAPRGGQRRSAIRRRATDGGLRRLVEPRSRRYNRQVRVGLDGLHGRLAVAGHRHHANGAACVR